MTSIIQQLEDVLGGVLPKLSGTQAEKDDLIVICRSSASNAAEMYWTTFGCTLDTFTPHERFDIIQRLIKKQVDTVREIHAAMGLVDPEFDLEMVAAITSAFRQRLDEMIASSAGGRA